MLEMVFGVVSSVRVRNIRVLVLGLVRAWVSGLLVLVQGVVQVFGIGFRVFGICVPIWGRSWGLVSLAGGSVVWWVAN